MTDSVHVMEIGGWRGKRNVVYLSFSSSQFRIVASLVDKVQGWWYRAGTDPTRENGGTAKRFPFMGLSLAYKQVSCQTLTWWMQLLLPKKFALLNSELTSGNCFADTKNKLSRKTFNSVLCEELELGRVAAAVPCALNTFLSQNEKHCVSIIWLRVCTHFLLAQLILWALLHIQAKEYT